MPVVNLERFPNLIILSVVVSIMLSIWCVWADPVVNNDGVHYFRSAKQISAGNWSSAMSLHTWPFYPALVSLVSSLSGWGVELSAHIVDALLYALLTVAFLAVIFELGGDRRVLIIAAVIVLTLPSLNKYRSYIIRDAGFWALYLWSLAFLFRYWRTRLKSSIFGWASCVIVALLFRVEAIAFLVGVPMLLSYRDSVLSRAKWGMTIVYPLLLTVLFLLLVAWVLRHDASLDSEKLSGDTIGSIQQAWIQLADGIQQKIDILREQFLQYSSKRYAGLVYLASLTVAAFAELVRGLSVVYAVIVGYGIIRKTQFPLPGARFLWFGLIAINCLVVIGFTLVMGFVVRRYMMALILTALLVVPFVFSHLYDKWWLEDKGPKFRFAFVLLVVLCIGVSVKGLDVFTDKRYLRDAGHWLQANTPTHVSLYSDNLILSYYSEKNAYHKGNNYDWANTVQLVETKRWKAYDYLAVEIGHTRQDHKKWLLKTLSLRPIQVFKNRKGDEVLIFQTKNN